MRPCTTSGLVDTSVWAQKSNLRIRDWFRGALVDGELVIFDMVALEILQGAGAYGLFEEIRGLLAHCGLGVEARS